MAKPKPESIITDFADLRSLSPRRYSVRLMRYRKGAEPIAEDLASSFSSANHALREADRLQAEADERAEPVTAYVVDDAGVPVGRAGGRP